MHTCHPALAAVVTMALLSTGCDSKNATAPADAGPPARSAAYDQLKTEAALVSPTSFAAGEVALAKGRKIAPVERSVTVAWAPEEQALLRQGGEIASIFGAVAQPRSPYCPGNQVALCTSKDWYAQQPADAGVIVYVERRVARSGAYFVSGSDVSLGNAYDGVLQLDAVLVPEKLHVARWWRKIQAPRSTYTDGAGLQLPKQNAAVFEGDMRRLLSGQAPESDFATAPWDTPRPSP